MRIYILKVFGRNFSKMVGVLLVFMLISLLIASPTAISYAEREKRVLREIAELDYHLLLNFDIRNKDPVDIDRFLDTVYNTLDDFEQINMSMVMVELSRVQTRFDNRTGKIPIAFVDSIDSLFSFVDVEVISGEFRVGDGYISLNIEHALDKLGFFEKDVGKEIEVIGLEGQSIRFNVSSLFFGYLPVRMELPPFEGYLSSIVDKEDFKRIVGNNLTKFQVSIFIKFDPEYLRGDQFTIVQRIFMVTNSTMERISEEYRVFDFEASDRVSDILLLQSFEDIIVVTMTGFYSFPYIFGIWFLALINFELIVRSFRRDLGLLQLRGVSNKSVRRHFFIFLFITATIGLILGLLISPFVSNMIISYLGYSPIPYSNYFRIENIVFTFILGYIIMVIAYFRRVKLIKETVPIAASRKYFEPFEKTSWSPSMVFTIFFILSIVKMVEWALAIDVNQYITGFGALAVIFIIYSIISGFMNILAPIIIVYGVVNLVTYKTRFIPVFTRVVASLISGRIKELVYRYGGRLPGLISRTTFISGLLISLMLYYVIFSGRTLVFFDSISYVNSELGTSVRVSLRGVNVSLLDDIVNEAKSLLDRYGVEDSYVMLGVPGYIQFLGEFTSVNYIFVDDIQDFLKRFNIKDWMVLTEVDSPKVISSLEISRVAESLVGAGILEVDPTLSIFVWDPYTGESTYRLNATVDALLGVDLAGLFYSVLVDDDVVDFNRIYNFTSAEVIVITDDVEKVMEILREGELISKYYAGTQVEEHVGDFQLGFANTMSILQKNLYSFNVFAIVAVLIAITLLSIEYVMDIVPDLIVMRSRGLYGASKRFVYSLILPIIFFSIIVGSIVGVIAGYGASQQMIISMSEVSPDFPLFMDWIGPIYLIIILGISIVIPSIVMATVYRRYVREVVYLG